MLKNASPIKPQLNMSVYGFDPVTGIRVDGIVTRLTEFTAYVYLPDTGFTIRMGHDEIFNKGSGEALCTS